MTLRAAFYFSDAFDILQDMKDLIFCMIRKTYQLRYAIYHKSDRSFYSMRHVLCTMSLKVLACVKAQLRKAEIEAVLQSLFAD